MKHKELFWMVAPCLLILGIGTYFAQRANEPLHLVIDVAKVVPVTARDIAEGYDTRVWLQVHLGGRQVKNPDPRFYRGIAWNDRVISLSTGQEVQWPHGIEGMSRHTFGTDNGEARTMRFKLNKLPKTVGAVELRLDASSVLEPIGAGNRGESTPPIALKIPLRASGSPIVSPSASKSLPFELVGFKTSWSTTPVGQAVKLTFVTHRLEPPDSTSGHNSVALNDIKMVMDAVTSPLPGGYDSGYDEKTGITEINLGALGSNQITVPTSARNVVLKANLSLNECWPLPISVVLRKDGKNIARVKPTME